jgi:hypothetical protein
MANYRGQSAQSVPRGFMEPIAGATYHEDIYGVSQFEEDRVESYAFDLYEGSDDDDSDDEGDRRGNTNKTPSKRRQLVSGPSSASRGVIKKPKCRHIFRLQASTSTNTNMKIHADKPRSELEAGNRDNPFDLTAQDDEEEEEGTADPHTARFKISQRQNPRHSISVTSAVSAENNDPDDIERVADKSPPITSSPSDLKNKRNAEAFSAEKSRQHQLTPSARFESVRKQCQRGRETIHAAGGKARKVKERAQRRCCCPGLSRR